VDGSFGFVINRPTGKNVVDFLPDEGLGGLENVPVFIGGPVAQDQLTFASFEWDKQSVVCRSHLHLNEAREMVEDDSVLVRAFVGYSGWTKGQLEEELDQKAWLVQKPDHSVLDIGSCPEMWHTIMREHGPWFKLLAAAPDDPSQN